ncbi:MAG: DUF1015 family protein, partial [Gemmatimonadales bacterium]
MNSTATPLVIPFVGERYSDVGSLSALIAPPYDVISDDRRSVLETQHEHNVVHLTL